MTYNCPWVLHQIPSCAHTSLGVTSSESESSPLLFSTPSTSGLNGRSPPRIKRPRHDSESDGLPELYPLDKPVRGYAIIFNQEHFQGTKITRKGSSKDRDALNALFLAMKLRVIVWNDLTKDKNPPRRIIKEVRVGLLNVWFTL